MCIRIGCAHLDRLLSYPDLYYLSGSSLPIRIFVTYPDVVDLSGYVPISGRGCPTVVRALCLWCACGMAPCSITSFPPISHVIPRGLFQITKLHRCNSNAFLGYSKVTGLNYVRHLWGSVRDGVLQHSGGGREPGRAVAQCCADTKRAGPMQSHRPRFPHKEGSDAQWRGVPWARASRISVRSLTSSETSASGASSAAF